MQLQDPGNYPPSLILRRLHSRCVTTVTHPDTCPDIGCRLTRNCPDQQKTTQFTTEMRPVSTPNPAFFSGHTTLGTPPHPQNPRFQAFFTPKPAISTKSDFRYSHRPMTQPPDSAIRSCRTAVDLAVAFVVAVMLLRAFVLEGYLISTGSMAPGLCGFHRRVHCPACQYVFAFGVAFDDSTPGQPGTIQEPSGPRRLATCPNCGQSGIDVASLPNNHGDQLLVHKHTYDLRKPRRWETVDRKSTRLNSSHIPLSRMPSSA